MKELFQGAIKFQEEDFASYQELYESLGQAQNPHTLFISCSDSRILPNLITNSDPGDLFVVRNVGNIVPPYTEGNAIREGYLATTAAIEYAIVMLEVKTIIICGHSNCGAIASMFEPEKLEKTPYLKKWIELLDPVKKSVLEISPDSKSKRILFSEELNIRHQIENLMTYPFVEERFDRGELNIYGWYYIIERGEILNYNMITGRFRPIA